MQAGRLNRRITLHRPLEARSPTGDVSKTWEPLATVWARKLTVAGKEAFAGQALIGTTDVGLAIRYSAALRQDLDQRCRFELDGDTYNISSVVESERRTELIVLGTRGNHEL